jgi:hypothetical protein
MRLQRVIDLEGVDINLVEAQLSRNASVKKGRRKRTDACARIQKAAL